MFTGASLAPGTRAAGSDSVPSLLDSLVKGKTTVRTQFTDSLFLLRLMSRTGGFDILLLCLQVKSLKQFLHFVYS